MTIVSDCVTVQTMTEFDKNNRDLIEAALKNPDNPIAKAIFEGVQKFNNRLVRMAKENAEWPTKLMLTKPQTEFDDIVIRLTLESIATELGQEIEIHWV